MSTRSNAISTRRRSRLAQARATRVVVCLTNAGYEVSLEPRKFYLAIRDPEAEAHEQLRVVDESGEDYLFPASYFATMKLAPGLRRRLFAAV